MDNETKKTKYEKKLIKIIEEDKVKIADIMKSRSMSIMDDFFDVDIAGCIPLISYAANITKMLVKFLSFHLVLDGIARDEEEGNKKTIELIKSFLSDDRDSNKK